LFKPFELSISVLRRDHYPGDILEGVVSVDTDKAARASIYVWLEARLTGSGTAHTESVAGAVIFDGEVASGTNRYPVVLHVPNGPFTYDGTAVSLTWFVCARADVPRSRDPQAECEFELKHRPTEMALVHVPRSRAFELEPTNSAQASLGVLVTFALFLGTAVAFALWPGKTVFIIFCFAVLLTLDLIHFGPATRRALAEYRLGPVRLDLSPGLPAPGDAVSLTCSFSPKKSVAIRTIHAEFIAKEVAVKGSGRNKRVHIENVFRDLIPIDENVVLGAGEDRAFVATCELPEDAPFSFDFPRNQLEWMVTVHLDLPGWPDWAKDTKFTVLPSNRMLENDDSGPVATEAPSFEDKP
jgi:hypothetical protein